MKIQSISGQTAPGVLFLAVAVMFSACGRSPEAKSAAFLDAGKNLLRKNDVPRAILQFQNATQAAPRNPETYYQLGTAYVAGGDWSKGVANLRKALEIDPKHVKARLLIAQLMTYSDQPSILKDAQNQLQSLLRDSPDNPQGLEELASAELKLGESGDAIENLGRAMAGAPQDLTIAVTLAEARLRQNDAKGAEDVLKKACENSPKSADAVVVLGRFYLSQQKPAEAEQQFRRALEMNAKSAPALLNLATLQNQNGQKPEAEKNFARLAALPDKTYSAAHATFLFQNGRREEAVREFESLYKSAPGDRMARTRLVVVYNALNRGDDAKNILAKALKENPKDLDALLQRGEFSLAAGKYADAQRDFNSVLLLQPNSARVHYVIAQLHRAQGQELTYRQELAEALRLDPYMLSARLESAQVLIAVNQAQSALTLLDQSPPSQKGSVPVVVERNWVLWALNDLPAMRKGIDQGLALARTEDLLLQDGVWKLRLKDQKGGRAALDEALKVAPEDLRALSVLRASYTNAKEDKAGLKAIQDYAARNPKSAALQEYLGFQLLMKQDFSGANAAFDAALTANPASTSPEVPMALVDIADHKLDSAASRLKKVLAADSSNVPVRLLLGKLQDRQGNHAAALDEFQKVVNQDPNNAEGLNNLAYLLEEQKKESNQALKYAQRARELAPNNPEYADTLGWIFYHQGLYSSAIEQLGIAASHTGNPVWKYHLAMAYAKAGNMERGRSTLDAALKANPNLPEAKTAKEMLEAR